MTGPIISKLPLPIPASDLGQTNPGGVAVQTPETPGSFQEMLAMAAAPLSALVAEWPASKGDSQVGKKGAETLEYTIRQGDTLSEVVAAAMRQQGISFSRNELYNAVNRVAAANGLANPDYLLPGQKIRLTGMSSAPGQAPDFAALAPASSQDESLALQAPAHGRLSSPFGMRLHPVFGREQHHDGIDISLPVGTPIQPVDAGTVTFAGERGGYGQLVEIDHGNGLTSRYAHLSEILVSAGEKILPDNHLGLAGQSGLATGPHLHLEIRRDNQPVNPLLMLSREGIETGRGRKIV
ncbi:MAG: M23 family metallopeptidase [Desulfurivibrionaceae bacterium]